ncbi:MAG: glycosyltransferase [Chloroflexota bacterium]
MKPIRAFLALLSLLQAVAGARVLWRLWRSRGGPRIAVRRSDPAASGLVSIIVPVLNEQQRLAPCLAGLLKQGPEVAQILVVDGGSQDGTRELVAQYARHEPRLKLFVASPPPANWNGKAWGLQEGIDHCAPTTRWLLTIDADVRPAAQLSASLLAYALAHDLLALSVATHQDLRGSGLGLLHPALLATLVYRFGIPGGVARRVSDVQANGQCFLVRRDALRSAGGLAVARASRCEDVTLARALVLAGVPVGFFETEGLVDVAMYADAAEAWRNWPRSLPMRDRFWNRRALVALAEVALTQALPLPLYVLLSCVPWSGDWTRQPRAVNAALLLARLGVLIGMRRAYRRPPWSYWLSPALDLPVTVRLIASALQQRQRWRGRLLVSEGLS